MTTRIVGALQTLQSVIRSPSSRAVSPEGDFGRKRYNARPSFDESSDSSGAVNNSEKRADRLVRLENAELTANIAQMKAEIARLSALEPAAPSAAASVTLGEEIGQGSCSTVYRGSWSTTDVAVKVWRRGCLSEEREQFGCDLLFKLRHPNIIAVFQRIFAEGMLIMELMVRARFVCPACTPLQPILLALVSPVVLCISCCTLRPQRQCLYHAPLPF